MTWRSSGEKPAASSWTRSSESRDTSYPDREVGMAQCYHCTAMRLGGVLLLAVGACFTPEVTHCDNIDCPAQLVCDGLGGCATPEQLSQCTGQSDGATCSYTTITSAHVGGACEQGVCRS